MGLGIWSSVPLGTTPTFLYHFYDPPIPLHWALLEPPTLSDRARLDDLILRTSVGLVPAEYLSRTFPGAYSDVFHFSIGE